MAVIFEKKDLNLNGGQEEWDIFKEKQNFTMKMSKRIIVLQYSKELIRNLHLVCSELERKFKEKSIIWIGLPINSRKSEYEAVVECDFGFAYITSITPFGVIIEDSIALIRYIKPQKVDVEHVCKKIEYIVKEYNYNGKATLYPCKMTARLSKETLSTLRSFCLKSQKGGEKEITGFLRLIRIENSRVKKGLIHVIEIDMKTVKRGGKEKANMGASRFNFHTHPEEAYIKYSVKNAWPSVTDYLGFLKLGNRTIFHCVSTMEGIYILSFSKYWVLNLKEIDKNFINRNFKIDNRNSMTPVDYCKMVNAIEFKGYPIYKVRFFDWKGCTGYFSVFYKSADKTCLQCDKDQDEYAKLLENSEKI